MPETLRKGRALAIFAAAAILFLIANRGAYEGYFDGDDLDNISWTPGVTIAQFASGAVSPRFFPHNFRPAGHFVYHVLASTAGLRYPPYVAVIHAIHLLNLLLVWFIMRRLELRFWPSLAGCLFFAFHMAVFDAYWKPMYVFDLLCASFCLLSLLAYAYGRYVAAFVCLWLAYKSKELAVMLPLALAAYEWWFGERRWRRLIPFFAVSLLFGVQGVFLNPHANGDYAMRFTFGALAKTVPFYASLVFLAPWAGLALLAVPFLVRDRRVWFGTLWFGVLLVPMLFLPGRLFGAYLYAPLAGVAIVLAVVASKGNPRLSAALAAAFFAFWIPWNHARLRENRRAALTFAAENRTYVEGIASLARKFPESRAFVYDGVPAAMHSWGVFGMIRHFYGVREPAVYPAGDPDARKAFDAGSFAVLNWDPSFRRLIVLTHPAGELDSPYVKIAQNHRAPIWQLGEGWYSWEWNFRWIRPYATARLYRPAGARRFELLAHIGPGQIRDLGHTAVSVFLNGKPAGRAEFTATGVQPVRWQLPPSPPGPVTVEFRVEPVYTPGAPDRPLGIPIAGFGFVED